MTTCFNDFSLFPIVCVDLSLSLLLWAQLVIDFKVKILMQLRFDEFAIRETYLDGILLVRRVLFSLVLGVYPVVKMGIFPSEVVLVAFNHVIVHHFHSFKPKMMHCNKTKLDTW